VREADSTLNQAPIAKVCSTSMFCESGFDSTCCGRRRRPPVAVSFVITLRPLVLCVLCVLCGEIFVTRDASAAASPYRAGHRTEIGTLWDKATHTHLYNPTGQTRDRCAPSSRRGRYEH